MSAYLRALHTVQHSRAVRDYLNFVREVGNFVNDGGFAGNAAGFGVRRSVWVRLEPLSLESWCCCGDLGTCCFGSCLSAVPSFCQLLFPAWSLPALQLESLAKLRDVKSVTPGLTLLHYIAQELTSHHELPLFDQLNNLNNKVHEVWRFAPTASGDNYYLVSVVYICTT